MYIHSFLLWSGTDVYISYRNVVLWLKKKITSFQISCGCFSQRRCHLPLTCFQVKYKEKFDKELKGKRPKYDLKESKIYQTLKDANTLASEVGALQLWHHTSTSVSVVSLGFVHFKHDLQSAANQAALCLLKPRAGEVQRRLEEDPQACFWHVGVFVHAARPEHQQTVQPGKTVQSWNLLISPLCARAPPSSLNVTELWVTSSHCSNQQHAADYWPPLGLIQLHHPNILILWPHLAVTILSPFDPLLTFFMLASFITLPLPFHFCFFPLVTTNLSLVTS